MSIITIIQRRVNFIFAAISLMLFASTCITPFDPEIDGNAGLIVVDGSIIKGRLTQVITISKTSRISQPEYVPVENCQVSVMDNTGTEFGFGEVSPGKYIAVIEDMRLTFDKQYKLKIITSSGAIYESDYQHLLETDPVDSIYAIRENHYSSITGTESINGMQFYVDLDARNDASRYYRWVLEETYEEHARYEIWGVYDGETINLFNPGDSLLRCWHTKDITGLYSASTDNLSENRIRKIPLHFVESNSPKLCYRYCATVRQYALNEDAYDYWHQKEKELKEFGNIYTSQPSQPISNIHNINNPDEQVMGFFWAASCAIKRIYVRVSSSPTNIDECNFIGVYCESTKFSEIEASIRSAMVTFAYYLPDPPIYITMQYGNNYDIVITPQCVDCRLFGGEVHKPDFWE